ncbi:MAG TPA: hypothetical protein VEH27_07960 [Methylomirabilota bacterium]|nr:hypothetical protein [Methylomirabilota bacterium]
MTLAKANTRGDTISFFRQSGWMVIATTSGGVFMLAVHFFATKIDPEYSVFQTLLNLLNLMLIPSIGLQTVFAQQTAAAVTPDRQKELRASVRGVLGGTFALWCLMLLATFFVAGDVAALWKMKNQTPLWIAVGCGLALLWLPILQGVLQGAQNFMWLGWTAIANGIGRFAFIGIIVGVLGGKAAGAMFGAFLGMWTAVALALWHSRSVLKGESSHFSWKEWLSRVVPLTLGLGVGMFFLSADQLVVQSFFDGETTRVYSAAGMFARGLVMFTSPLTSVMFPKIVQSAARSEKTSVLWQAFGATALLGAGAALFCTIFPTFPIKLVFRKPEFLAAADYLPLFVWSMFPLTLTGVLMSNLLARGRFAVVPWMLLAAAGYAAGLSVWHQSFREVITTLGVFNLIALAVVVIFTVKEGRRS